MQMCVACTSDLEKNSTIDDELKDTQNVFTVLCFIVLSSFCILLYTRANVICIKFLLTYLLCCSFT